MAAQHERHVAGCTRGRCGGVFQCAQCERYTGWCLSSADDAGPVELCLDCWDAGEGQWWWVQDEDARPVRAETPDEAALAYARAYLPALTFTHLQVWYGSRLDFDNAETIIIRKHGGQWHIGEGE